MTKITELEIDGKVYHLTFNVQALLDIQDEFGIDFLEKMQMQGTQGMKINCKILEILSIQGNLARKNIGHSDGDIIDAAAYTEKLLSIESVAEFQFDFLNVRAAVSDTISKGYFREEDGDDDGVIDLGLRELQREEQKENKKKQAAPTLNG